MLKKQLEEKNFFLKRAYEIACEEYPASPLSVNMNPLELGASIGFDEAAVSRIMTELVQDRYVDSGLGMKILLIRKEGVNYLREIESEKNIPQPINVYVGNNSNLQFQNNSPHSSQTIELKNHDTESLLKLIEEIKSGLDTIQKYLTPDEIENLKIETNYLESNIKKQSPDKSLLNKVTTNILDILKAVPANVIANIITNQIKF
ncbi:MAG: hypothetical protein JWP12_2468 [Bacteroidetes bacterium]|nr:hypothetical protein [Bacteroidota bacterium]